METIEKDEFVILHSAVDHKHEGVSKGTLSNRLLSFIYKLDTEFPLSGGETQEDMTGAVNYMEHEAHSLLKGVDANFPLSGGE